VEPVAAPGKPYHLLSQQLLAQMLQHKGVSRGSWDAGLETFLAEAQLDRSAGDEVLSLLEARELVAADSGVYWFTATGERRHTAQAQRTHGDHGRGCGLCWARPSRRADHDL
jgi:hypothetical protein